MFPIRKVVLYKHGIGYFERQVEVEGDAALDLRFKESEMNDVLKSLTTLDLGGGLITSISYEAHTKAERRLDEAAVTVPQNDSLTGLLAQIKGARVAVERGQTRVEGEVVGIETTQRREGAVTTASPRLVLLVDGRSLEAFDLLEVRSVTLEDEGLRHDLQHVLDVLLSATRKDRKRLTIRARGAGRRVLLASYVVETPVWKTSYRILLGEAPLVQGWALVDNTQDEDWDDVSLSLVAGLPVSFVHDLYSARYKRRPVVEVQEEEAYAPPLLEAAVEEELDFALEASPPPVRAAAAPRRFAPAAARVSDRERVAAITRSADVQTRTVEVGDLFSYEIRNPITVKRGQAALVPILQAGFEGKRVAVYNQAVRDKNPLSAVLFRNTTGLTLEGGPVTVLEEGAYVGEAMLETLRLQDERLLPYSVELGCTVTQDHRSDLSDVHSAHIAGGTLHLRRYSLSHRTYVIHNRSEKALDLFLEHRFLHGWALVDTPEPAARTDNFYRFRLDIPPRETTRFTVTERSDHQESYAVLDAASRDWQVWLDSRFIDERVLRELKTLSQVQQKVATLQRRIAGQQAKVLGIHKNQERLRQNLQALGGSHDEKRLTERYVSELGAEEDALKSLTAEIDALTAERDALQVTLQERIAGISFEAQLSS